MNFIYHFHSDTHHEMLLPVRAIYVRPFQYDAEGEKEYSRMYAFYFVAIQHYLKAEYRNDIPEMEMFNEIVFHKMEGKPYYFRALPLAEKAVEYGVADTMVYIDTEQFAKNDVFEWIKTYFVLHQVQCDAFTEGDADDFMEVHPTIVAMRNAVEQKRNNLNSDESQVKIFDFSAADSMLNNARLAMDKVLPEGTAEEKEAMMMEFLELMGEAMTNIKYTPEQPKKPKTKTKGNVQGKKKKKK